MKKLIKLFTLIFVVAFVFCATILVSKAVKATNPSDGTSIYAGSETFEMVNEANLRIGASGLSFKLKMNKAIYDEVTSEGAELHFALVPEKNIERIAEEVTATESTFNITDYETTYLDITIAAEYIYAQDDLYVAKAGVSNIKEANYGLNYVGWAYYVKNNIYTFAKFPEGGYTHVMTSAENECNYNVLEGSSVADIFTTYSWFGTKDYPLTVTSEDEYKALVAVIEENADLFSAIEIDAKAEVVSAINADTDYTSLHKDAVNIINNGHVYTVTWKNGEATIKSETLRQGSSLTKPEAPYRNGYEVVWQQDGVDFALDTKVSTDLVLNAKYNEVEGMFIDFNNASMANVWSSAGTSTWQETYDDAYGVIKLDITKDITGDGNWWGPTEGNSYWKPAFEKDYYTNYDRLVVKYQASTGTDGSYKLTLFTGNGAWTGKVIVDSNVNSDGWQYAVLDYTSVKDNYDTLKNFCLLVSGTSGTSIYIDSIMALKSEDSVGMWQSFGSPSTFWTSTGKSGWLYEYQGAQGVIYNEISSDQAGSDKFFGADGGTTAWHTKNTVDSYDNTNTVLKFRVLVETESEYSLKAFFGSNGKWEGHNLISGTESTDGWQEVTLDLTATGVSNIVDGFDIVNNISFISNTTGATKFYIDSILILKTIEVNYGGYASEYVVVGEKAKGSLIQGGYLVEKWQLNGADFDFNTPITGDITLTAVYPQRLWYDFNSTSDVKWGHLGGTFEANEGVNGAVKYTTTTGVGDGYMGNIDCPWIALPTKEECVGMDKLIFRAKIESDGFNALTLFGVPFASFGKVYNDQLATSGYQDFVLNIDVYENYDAIKNFFFICWCGTNNTTIYLDYVIMTKNVTITYDNLGTETINLGQKASGSLIQGGYLVEKWQLNGVDYDFSVAPTTDITLTAVNKKLVWYDFNSASDVRWGSLTNTFDPNEGINGALKWTSTQGVADGYMGNVDCPWTALPTKDECVGMTKLILRAKIEGGAFNTQTLFGVPFASFGRIYGDQLATNGYQDFVLNIDVYENYDAIKNFFFIEWCNDATTLYYDYILVE